MFWKILIMYSIKAETHAENKIIIGITKIKWTNRKKSQNSLLLALPENVQNFWKHIFIESQKPKVGKGWINIFFYLYILLNVIFIQ